jgi:hypothetical protein
VDTGLFGFEESNDFENADDWTVVAGCESKRLQKLESDALGDSGSAAEVPQVEL